MAAIEIPDDIAAGLRARAEEYGLTLDEWLKQLASWPPRSRADLPPDNAAPADHRHISEIICENMADVPPEVWDEMPRDGASQHDHYIYGWPKREP